MPFPYMGTSTTKPQTMLWLLGTRGSPKPWQRLAMRPALASAAQISPSGGPMAMSRCTILSPPR